jgi:hypothetical protein
MISILCTPLDRIVIFESDVNVMAAVADGAKSGFRKVADALLSYQS